MVPTQAKEIELKLVGQELGEKRGYGLNQSDKPHWLNSNNFRAEGDRQPAFDADAMSGVPDGFISMSTMWRLYQKEAKEQDQELVNAHDIAARWVNVLWFLSLVLSMGAAMVAMLAKEWLSWFLTYTTKDPHKYALQRQLRFEALKSWRALLLIDLLPTLLHFSLLLFTGGLIVRLWLIDTIVAIIITVTSGAVALSYLTATILGACYELCPYKGRMSKYIRRLLRSRGLAENPQAEENANEQTTDRSKNKSNEYKSQVIYNWNALQWFFDHARSPADVNDMYQSLSAEDGSNSFIKKMLDLVVENPKYHSQLLYMGSEAIAKLKKALADGGRELVLWNGSNAATYALLIADIYPYIRDVINEKDRKIPETGGNEKAPDNDTEASSVQEKSARPLWNAKWIKIFSPRNAQDTITKECNKAKEMEDEILSTITSLWGEDQRPYFIPNACAGLVTAELKLVSCVIQKRLLLASNGLKDAPQGHTEIPILSYDRSTELLCHYKETHQMGLRRASLLLYYHINRRAPMGGASLRALLAALDNPLTPPTAPATPAPGTGSLEENRLSSCTYKVTIARVSTEHKFDLAVIDEEHGLLACLINLLGAKDLLRETQIAVINALVRVVPMRIEQWATASGITTPKLGMRPCELSAPNLDEHIVSQLKSFACSLEDYWGSKGIRRLAYHIFVALQSRSNHSSMVRTMIQLLVGRPKLYGGWIAWAARHLVYGDNKRTEDQLRYNSSTICTVLLRLNREEAKESNLDEDVLIHLASLIRLVSEHPPDLWEINMGLRFWDFLKHILQHQECSKLEYVGVYYELKGSLGALHGALTKQNSKEGGDTKGTNDENKRNIDQCDLNVIISQAEAREKQTPQEIGGNSDRLRLSD
ncbi:hypothetical protein RHS01_10265 [Rhizoctonia solani]|uniref:DUF6535 domain-containing protein n=1 Tax=Rhizoctonia solani TaxID=456999 RepID=A0A8H7I2A7_9AGAM|nr:hypothetical protein RHS01_10265 [Rhizoctonia solani]